MWSFSFLSQFYRDYWSTIHKIKFERLDLLCYYNIFTNDFILRVKYKTDFICPQSTIWISLFCLSSLSFLLLFFLYFWHFWRQKKGICVEISYTLFQYVSYAGYCRSVYRNYSTNLKCRNVTWLKNVMWIWKMSCDLPVANSIDYYSFYSFISICFVFFCAICH